MTAGVSLSSIKIDAFRGISSSITFDFSAPITLIYAPNGTGKTTICEAVEWLLTGQVERLRDRGEFDPKVLRSKFVVGAARSPEVTAQLIIGGDEYLLERSLAQEEQRAYLTGSDGRKKSVGKNDLLAILAPAAAAQEAHPLRAINLRQQWVRGTRFLSAEALAALVDSDDETIERRKQVFADLLGVRHLLDAEKLCDSFIADLGSREREFANKLVIYQDEVTDLTSELDSEGYEVSVVSLVKEVSDDLGLDIGDFGSPTKGFANAIEYLSVEVSRRKHILDERFEAFSSVSAEGDFFSTVKQNLDELLEKEAGFSSSIYELDERRRASSALIAEIKERYESSLDRVRTFAAAKEVMAKLVVSLMRALAELEFDFLPQRRVLFGELLEFFPEAGWTEEAIRQRQNDVAFALESQGASENDVARLEFLKIELNFAEGLSISEEEIAALQIESDRLEMTAFEARRRFDSTSGPISRLRAAATDLFEHEHDIETDECPVCGHHWGASEWLKRAIKETLMAAPELSRIASIDASNAEVAARLARDRLDEAVQHKVKVESIRADVRRLEVLLERRGQDLERLGVSATDPRKSLTSLNMRLAVAKALFALLRELEKHAPIFAVMPIEVLKSDIPIDSLDYEFDSNAAALDHVVQLELANIVQDYEVLLEEKDGLRAEYAVAQQALKGCREEIAKLRTEAERLGALWDKLAHGLHWTNDSVASIREELYMEQRFLAKIEARTAAARVAWAEEVRRSRLQVINEALVPLRRKLEHVRGRIAAARRAKAVFNNTYNEVSNRQIEDLSRVVNPLFARMHANRVFDKIKLGVVENPLQWLADAGNQELDPGKDFSQGQRQDLALALFLARARSLGGTFFLDEPVTHLDDLNRVALLDIFRATALESHSSVNLVVTTASRTLARHLIEKFSAVRGFEGSRNTMRPLRVIELDGNGRTGVTMRYVYPVDPA